MNRVSSFLILGLIFTFLSAYGLVWLVTERLPELPERGLMYFLVITFFYRRCAAADRLAVPPFYAER